MRNFRDNFARFMMGRYGIDSLYFALLTVSLIFMFVNIFIRSPLIGLLLWVVLIWLTFRTFSRNIYKRRMENEKFMRIWKPVKAESLLTLRRIQEIKTHRFRKCPHCKVVLRLPRKTGKHTVKCPCCHQEFELHIFL